MLTIEYQKYLSLEHYYASVLTETKKKGGTINYEINPKEIIHEILNSHFDDVITYISTAPDKVITKHNIPQFHKIYEGGTYDLIHYLVQVKDYGVTYETIGKCTLPAGGKENAYVKRGEIQAKLALGLDLVYILTIKQKKHVYLTGLGRLVAELPETDFKNFISKQIFIIPIIQFMIKRAICGNVEIEKTLKKFLSPETALRRAYSIKSLLTQIKNQHAFTYNYNNELLEKIVL